ncbi:MAG: ankyrin repeat domain-containing protein, partial [Limisphaerales bacterium]
MKQLLITIAALVLVGCGPRMSIHEAALEGNIEVVKQHLAAGTDVNAKNEGMTPLHWVAYKCNSEIIELLIAKGADVNVKCEAEYTPLHHAVQDGVNFEKIVKLLIANGADVNVEDVEGQTTLHHA